jgi:putative FmdB family regulatory protein|tara:strand:+ start:62 stop:313 length:252 start_codon:yes stop_codon:yes gene_type:complete
MPRYRYRCAACNSDVTIFHLIAETPKECPQCDSDKGLTKLLSQFTTKKTLPTRKKVGQATEEFIEKSRDELARQKDEMKNNAK